MSEPITNEQMKRLISVLFRLPVRRISNWETDNNMINGITRRLGLNQNEFRRFMPLFLSYLQSQTINGNPINLNSDEHLINLYGESKFRSEFGQLVSSFLSSMYNQEQTQQSVPSTNLTNNQTQNQSSSNYFMQMMNLGMRMINESPQLRNWYGEMAGSIARQVVSQMFNQPPTNPGNNTIPTYNTNQNFQAQQVSLINQPPEIEEIANFFESILNPAAPYWANSTAVNLNSLKEVGVNFRQIRSFVAWLRNANTSECNTILNDYESVNNLTYKIRNNILVTVNEVADALFNLSELYPAIIRVEQIPSLEEPKNVSKDK